jgi:regulator of sigma E protease
MNFVLAFAIFVGLLAFRGMPVYSKYSNIGQVEKGSIAEKVGLLPGDRILSVNKEFVKSWDQMRYKIANSKGPIDLGFFRNNDLCVAHINLGASRILGISPKVIFVRQGILTAAKESALICSFQVTETAKLLAAKFSRGDKTQFMGPIGIYQAVAQASSDWVESLSLMALLSMAIGIFNLLPIPLLDGGWGLLFIWEGLTRKYPSAKAIYAFQLVGIAFLGLFLIYASCGDVVRLLGH